MRTNAGHFSFTGSDQLEVRILVARGGRVALEAAIIHGREPKHANRTSQPAALPHLIPRLAGCLLAVHNKYYLARLSRRGVPLVGVFFRFFFFFVMPFLGWCDRPVGYRRHLTSFCLRVRLLHALVVLVCVPVFSCLGSDALCMQ